MKSLSLFLIAISFTVASAGSISSDVIDCFDTEYYRYNSVQIGVDPFATKVFPGESIGFAGFLENKRTHPVANGLLFVKIFRVQDKLSTQSQGYDVVDQFVVKRNISIPAASSTPVKFGWRPSKNTPSGIYRVAMYFSQNETMDISGLNFTDDITGNVTDIEVVTSGSSQDTVAFEKTAVTVDGKQYFFARPPIQINSEKDVIVTTKINNPTKQKKSVTITYDASTWGPLVKPKASYTKKIVLQPQSSQTISQTIPYLQAFVTFVTIRAVTDNEDTSLLNVRYLYNKSDEARFFSVGLDTFPVQTGDKVTMYSCYHALTDKGFKKEESTVSLKAVDREGNEIASTENGAVIQSVPRNGSKAVFLATKNYDYIKLIAALSTTGASSSDEQVVIYDCAESQCVQNKNTFSQQQTFLKRHVTNQLLKVYFLIGIGLLFTIFFLLRKFLKNNL